MNITLTELADAIEAGCGIFPRKARVSFFRENDGACALGGAAFALGVDPVDLCDALPSHGNAICPLCGQRKTFYSLVTKLNDDHDRPREEIAQIIRRIARDRGEPDNILELPMRIRKETYVEY